MDIEIKNTEVHPLAPFLPENGRILMSGSFPPPAARWCMDWFYPNFQNDMWRIWGLIAAGDKDYFIVPGQKMFDKDKIVAYCSEIGLGLSDTGEEVVRTTGNASDKFLQVVKPRDFRALLAQMPKCRTIALTGEKAVDTLGQVIGIKPKSIALGAYIETDYFGGEPVKIWRMPSSSRAYPMKLELKAEYYRKLLSC